MPLVAVAVLVTGVLPEWVRSLPAGTVPTDLRRGCSIVRDRFCHDRNWQKLLASGHAEKRGRASRGASHPSAGPPAPVAMPKSVSPANA